MTDYKLRLYPHPGKYEGETMLTPYLHALSLDGCDDEEVSDEGWWYGLLRGPFADVVEGDDLTPGERAYLAECAGVILYEDGRGFVTAYLFDAGEGAQLERKWASLEADTYADNGDNGEGGDCE